MTTQEFSHGFDTLLNSYAKKPLFEDTASAQEIVLDEYEKSLFLTEAQEQLVLSYYNGKNTYSESFEKTEEIRRYLSDLIKTSEISPSTSTGMVLLSSDSQVFALPNDLWFITYEAAKLTHSSNNCTSDKEIEVVPVTQDDLHRTSENPFKGTGYRRAPYYQVP